MGFKFQKSNRDANHNEICAALRQAGCTVLDLSTVGDGCPDILVGIRNENILLEIKQGKGKLREKQEQFFGEWRGPVYEVRSVDDALRAIGLVRP